MSRKAHTRVIRRLDSHAEFQARYRYDDRLIEFIGGYAIDRNSGVVLDPDEFEAQAMAPTRSDHALVVGNVYMALRTALERVGSPCRVYPDGMSLLTGQDEEFVPDGMVVCAPMDRRDLYVREPRIVIEVLSPTSVQRDTTVKLNAYLGIPTLLCYLTVDIQAKRVTQWFVDHEGNGPGFHSEILTLDRHIDLIVLPAAVSVPVAAFFEGV